MPEQNFKWLKTEMIVILWEQPVLVSSTAKCSTEWEQSLLLMESVYRKNFLHSSECRELWQYVFLVGWRPLASLRMNAEIRNAVLLLRSRASAHFWKRSASHFDTFYINSQVTSLMQAHYTFLYRLTHNHTHTHRHLYLLLRTLTVMGCFCWMVCVYGKRA